MKLRFPVRLMEVVVGGLVALTLGAGSAVASIQPTDSKTPGHAQSAAGCAGHNLQVNPASGDITNPSHTDGGFYYETVNLTNPFVMCLGEVREWVHYTTRATKTWRITQESFLIAEKTFTLNPGYYYWTFHINRIVDDKLICLGATNTPGYSCG